METAISGLYASAPEPLPFAPSLDIRAFLLRRDQGNLLVYSATTLESEAPAIHDLGGVSRQYLGHRHEAMFTADGVAAPLFCHEDERESVARGSNVRLVPWAATGGRPYLAPTGRADARRRIDAVLERVRRGGDR